MWKNWQKNGIKWGMSRKIEISHRTIIFTVLFLLFLGLVYLMRDLILMLFVALLLTAILEPIVNTLSKIKIPRIVSVLVSYFIVFGVIGGVIALIIPALVDQTTSFVNALPGYLSNLKIPPYVSQDVVREVVSRLGSLPGEALRITISIFSNVISVLTVLVFAFYMLLARGKLEDHLGYFFGDEKKKLLGDVVDEIEKRLGGWARGEFALMFVVGLATYIGLSLLGIPFALPLAVLSGLLEIIPLLGPIISAIPGVIIGFGISPLTGIGVAAMAFLIQQLENYILVPKIMQNSVGVSPIVTLIALAVGARLAGITGMIISVPMVITLQVIAKNYLIKE